MIYLTPERKLGRVIIAIWTGPIMPSLTVMSVQVLKTIENLCPSLSVPYMFPIGVFGIRAHSSEHFEKVPDSSHLQMHASQPTAPMTIMTAGRGIATGTCN